MIIMKELKSIHLMLAKIEKWPRRVLLQLRRVLLLHRRVLLLLSRVLQGAFAHLARRPGCALRVQTLVFASQGPPASQAAAVRHAFSLMAPEIRSGSLLPAGTAARLYKSPSSSCSKGKFTLGIPVQETFPPLFAAFFSHSHRLHSARYKREQSLQNLALLLRSCSG
jgi:hypothetical protein